MRIIKISHVTPKLHEDDVVKAKFKGKEYRGTIVEVDADESQAYYWINFDEFEELNKTETDYDLLDWMEKIFSESELELLEASTRWEDIESDLDLVKDEIFHYYGGSWDVRKAKRMIHQNPRPTIQFEAKNAKYQIESGAIATYDKYLEMADTSVPIILISSKNADGSTGYFPIDGWHRIRKAIENNIDFIPAYVLTIEESKEITGEV